MRKTIKTIKRLANSSMGNPAFEITPQQAKWCAPKPTYQTHIIHAGMEGRSVDVEIETTKVVGNALSPSITRGQSNE